MSHKKPANRRLVTLAATVAPEQVKQIRKMARDEYVSISVIVRRLLKKALKESA